MQQLQAVILAGGRGTRLAEETDVRPKPMVEIGGKPILWHIMKLYNHYGVRDFIICLGYKGNLIKEYFLNYAALNADITIGADGKVTFHNSAGENWNVTLADTGQDTMTGGRLKRIRHYLKPNQPFFMTYGDGVSDVNVAELLKFHQSHGKKVTITGVLPVARFGALELDGARVRGFQEKPEGEGGYINGGYFVLHPEVLELIEGDETLWEREPLEQLAKSGEMMAYLHHSFWHPMDMLRDKQYLEQIWAGGNAPWHVW